MDILNYGVFAVDEECYMLISSVQHPYIQIPAKGIVKNIAWPNRFRCYYHVQLTEILEDDKEFLYEYLNASFRLIQKADWKVNHVKAVVNSGDLRKEFIAQFNEEYLFDLAAPMIFKTYEDVVVSYTDFQKHINDHFIHIQTTINKQYARYTKHHSNG